MTKETPNAAAFIVRWQHAGGSERANYQLFITELCELLAVPKPNPASQDNRDNAYVFERFVAEAQGSGETASRFMDCYRRGCFVLEAKKIRQGPATKGFDDAMLRARTQGEAYARALPVEEGRPPFVVVVDVGHVIELYAEFSRSGATYTPYPDPRSHRIQLADLAREDIRQRLRQLWLEPLALDPSRASAKVTREISQRLAEVAKNLEASGHGPEAVGGFLTRCLFSMFAEDVGLLPKQDGKGAFTTLLESLAQNPEQFVPMVGELWQAMDQGKFSVAIRAALPRFNGKLFKQPEVLPLTRSQIEGLLNAARADWTQVEPAIFGTLLERALDPSERHSLGAHYTPRAYVERLVLPTVIEPLRAEWNNVQAAALLLASEGKRDAARAEVDAYHHRLCQVRVLDPACGSGNFLYVTLEHMKRLEGEVLNQLEALDDGQHRIETEGLAVDPHQFLGLEINPRAAAIAEMVLWIGHLQWHYRTRGHVMPPQPVLRDFRNIVCRDAVLAYDSKALQTDAEGRPLSRWDGKTTRIHPVTGEAVPDENARIAVESYLNPRPATWPEADFVVGNPPFIGAAPMRAALGDGYVEALRHAWQAVPDSADFVMFWWHHAADLCRQGHLRAFGFITTNSLKQTFNRRVLEAHLGATPPLALAYAIPDHPWVDSADGAAVRIAMTVGRPGSENSTGRLLSVTREVDGGGEGLEVELEERRGLIHPDLRMGANVAACGALRANQGVSSPGVKLHGAGFIVTPEEAARLLPEPQGLIRPYRNGRDLTDKPRGVMVIDLFGLDAETVRSRYPAIYQWVLERVKPERDQNNRASYRDNWWIFGEARKDLRAALRDLPRYIATVETAKHRVFQFLDASIAADNKLIAIALHDPCTLGILSSQVHGAWAIAAGSRLGVGNDPVYVKTACFEKFPFPTPSPEQTARIGELAEALDAHRKARLAACPELTLTGLYNVLEKLRRGDTLSVKDKTCHEQGLVGVLKTLHDDLDAAVLEAYGWSDLLPSLARRDESFADAVLLRLVDLNQARAAEEAGGQVRWLRPDYKNPRLDGSRPLDGSWTLGSDKIAPPETPAAKQPWPATLPEQMAAVAAALGPLPQSEATLAHRFSGKGPWKKRLPQLLATLLALGRAHRDSQGNYRSA